MAGNLIKPTSSKAMMVDTFRFTHLYGDIHDITLNLHNGSHLSLSLELIPKDDDENQDLELSVSYDNFHPVKIVAEVKSTDGQDEQYEGLVEIIYPTTGKQLGMTMNGIDEEFSFNWIIEVSYLHNPITFTLDYEAKAETLQDLSDFSIICKERKFPCHKVVLASRSDCLAGLIIDMKNDKLDVKDFAPEVVENMINWMYMDKLPQELSIDDTKELFKIADEYRVESLKQTCEHLLLLDLDMSNALRRLHFAKKYGAEKLLEKSLKIVKENLGKLGFSKEFGILMADFPYILEDKNMLTKNKN